MQSFLNNIHSFPHERMTIITSARTRTRARWREIATPPQNVQHFQEVVIFHEITMTTFNMYNVKILCT